MGENGTDVSREAADMILVNDDFSTIIPAIEEGKAIYHNIRNFLRFQLSTSMSALLLIAFCIMSGLPTPLNAMQILWINIIMDGPPAQSLGVEQVDQDVKRQSPRKKNDNILDRSLFIRIVSSAFIIVSGTMLCYLSEISEDSQNRFGHHANTTKTFTTFVTFDLFNSLCCRSETKSIFRIGFTTNKAFLLAVAFSILGQILVIYVPFFQAIFHTHYLTLSEVFQIILMGSSIFWIDEARKFLSAPRTSKKKYESI